MTPTPIPSPSINPLFVYHTEQHKHPSTRVFAFGFLLIGTILIALTVLYLYDAVHSFRTANSESGSYAVVFACLTGLPGVLLLTLALAFDRRPKPPAQDTPGGYMASAKKTSQKKVR